MKAHLFLRNRGLLVVTGGEGLIFFHVVATGLRIRRGSEGKKGVIVEGNRGVNITTKQGMCIQNHQK